MNAGPFLEETTTTHQTTAEVGYSKNEATQLLGVTATVQITGTLPG